MEKRSTRRSNSDVRARARAKQEVSETAGHERPIPHILVVDDEKLICEQLQRSYSDCGYSVDIAASGENALDRLKKGDIDLVVTDIRLPGMSGVELTMRVRDSFPDLPVIVITGHAAIDSAIEVLKRGASDYIIKPFSTAAIQQATRLALEKAKVFTELRHLRRSLKGLGEFGGMLSKTPEMYRVFETIRMVAPTDMTVLVNGETGTGKELVATAIHYQSPRREGPFVIINCAGFPESLLESELFGYEKGAFTSADSARAGKIELANGGTLFLDEIESISVLMQSKLLRVLEDQEVQRLGGGKKIKIDMRVIAATNIPLEALLRQGKMRSDFYYRINVVPIHLILLRERREDIPLLVDDFLRHHPVAKQKGIKGVSPTVMNRLVHYHWPGNIRELQNVLEKAIVLCAEAVIQRIELTGQSSNIPIVASREATTPGLTEWLLEQERQYIIQQLKSYSGNVALTAKSCGLGIRTLSRKMRLYGLRKSDFQNKPSQLSLPVYDENVLNSKISSSVRQRNS